MITSSNSKESLRMETDAYTTILDSDPILRASGMRKGKGMITPAIAHQMEVSNALCILVNLLSSTPTETVLGLRNLYSNPICEGLRRLIEHTAPLYAEREVIPRVASTREKVPISGVILDTQMLEDTLEFLQRNSVLTTYDSVESVAAQLEKWSGQNIFLSPVIYGEEPGDEPEAEKAKKKEKV